MVRQNMECPAWRALSLPAQAIYPWLKLEWKGPKANNNGKISLSLRQIADRAGCNIKTAMRALHDLQRKGFVVVKRPANLGLDGEARSHLLELTEVACPPETRPRNLFKEWEPGADFPVAEVSTNNPEGRNGKKIPVPSRGMKRSLKGHEKNEHVPSRGKDRSPKGHEHAQIDPAHVPSKGTSLVTRGLGEIIDIETKSRKAQ
ncbi:hypothetical protein [Aliiruegeria lutimaris]|nr:hypothetical protein [Aliiruegeria lutimaris]